MGIPGFGNVGSHAALTFQQKGALVAAIGENGWLLENPNGIDVAALSKHVREDRRPSAEFKQAGTVLLNEARVEAPVSPAIDVAVPCAAEHQIRAAKAARVSAKMVGEGANGPRTADAGYIPKRGGVVVIPDVLAKGGGVPRLRLTEMLLQPRIVVRRACRGCWRNG